MKKGFAILLLFVYLFNLAGYSLWFQHLIAQSDSQFVHQLDNREYNDQELLEVKVPLHMPYINNSGDYERVDGQLEYKGIHYNYVKRRVSNDTLYVLCLPNVFKTQLYAAKATYGKEANDIPSNKKATETSKKAGFDTEHDRSANAYLINAFCMKSTITFPSFITIRLLAVFIAIPGQPPNAVGC